MFSCLRSFLFQPGPPDLSPELAQVQRERDVALRQVRQLEQNLASTRAEGDEAKQVLVRELVVLQDKIVALEKKPRKRPTTTKKGGRK